MAFLIFLIPINERQQEQQLNQREQQQLNQQAQQLNLPELPFEFQ